MAFESTGMDYGNDVAAEDYSNSGQYTAVEVTPTGFKRVTTAGGPIDGILQNTPRQNDAASVRFIGVSKARTGGAFPKGANLAVDAQGRFVLATTGQSVVGRSMMPSTAADQIANVFINSARTGSVAA